MKHTPLFDVHRRLGGRLIEFGGWEMPVQYTSIMDEHLTVRSAAGIFDISHMGEIRFSGGKADDFLNRHLTNDIRKLEAGQGQYTLMCHEGGGIIDDLYVYRLAPAEYLLIVNASRCDNDLDWLRKRLRAFEGAEDVLLQDDSDRTGAVAVQGPKVALFIDECFPGPSTGGANVNVPSLLKKNQIARFALEGAEVWVSRTGYTGEDGFEVVAPAEKIGSVWERILEAGKPHGLKPAGLGARDTLRTEVCYPLYGHELDEQTTPIEAGLGFFVALDKGEFAGRAVLAEQIRTGPPKKLIAFVMTDRSAPPRPQYAIFQAGNTSAKIGHVTSGTQSPSLAAGIGMGFVTPEWSVPDSAIAIEIRGKFALARIVRKPIYRYTKPKSQTSI